MYRTILRSAVLLIVLATLAVPAAAEPDVVGDIEQAHGEPSWDSQAAIKADLELQFAGAPRLVGTLFSTTSAGKSRIETADGELIVFDGEKAWVKPPDASFDKPRFDALTWPYFLAAPFKLDDPGVRIELLGKKELAGKKYEAAKVTFEEGVGDSPDDWYIIYKDPDNDLLKAMAYIVTYGAAGKNVEHEPHAIVYDGFETVDGVRLATNWKFYQWSENKGIHGEPIGSATLRNLSFVPAAQALFSKPEGAKEDKLPQQTAAN